jgi:hypothetical protein
VMVTFVPTGPLVGVNEVICGTGAVPTVKFVELVAVPFGLVTVTGPDRAPGCTVAVICVPWLFTVKVGSAFVPIFTCVAPVKLVPVIVTLVPAGPKVGVNDVMVGAVLFVTVKSAVLVAVPPAVVTLTLPVVAPMGTVAVICVSELTVKVVAEVVLNFTELAPKNPVPVIVTTVPTEPLVGEKDAIVGTGAAVTVKFVVLVAFPSAFVTWTFPDCVPLATVALICVLLSTVNASDLLPIFTWVTSWESGGLLKLVPVIVTTVPTGPLVGEKDEIVGTEANAGTAETIRETSTLRATVVAAPALPDLMLDLMGKPPSSFVSLFVL